MRNYFVRGAALVAVVALVVGGMASASWAKGHKVKPTVTSSLSSSSITLGNTAVDTATVTGTAAKGSPTGSVTFGVCGPTSVATKCTKPNAGSAIVGLSSESNNRSTASVTVDPSTTGWYCLRDKYSGNGHYKTVTDNSTATECLDVTSGGGGGGPYTPTIASALNPSTTTTSGSSTDTVTLTGNATAGSPTGTVTFGVCGTTSTPTPCTSPNVASATVELASESGNRSVADITIEDFSTTGWYCFLDQYSGDANYKAVNDNDKTTECLDVTSGSGGGGGTYTPTIKSAVSPTTTTLSGSSTDTVTLTGNATAGSPTGSVTYYVCGVTSTPTPCTSPNIGPASVELASESGNRSVAAITIENFSTTGWYCFLDEYSGDANYQPVSDNDSSTECVDVTGSSSASGGGSATLSPSQGATSRRGASKRLATLS